MKSKLKKLFALFLTASMLSGTVSATAFAETDPDAAASAEAASDTEEEPGSSDSTSIEPGLAGVPSYWWPDAVEGPEGAGMTIEDYDGSQREQIVRHIADKYDAWYGITNASLVVDSEDMAKITGLGEDATLMRSVTGGRTRPPAYMMTL